MEQTPKPNQLFLVTAKKLNAQEKQAEHDRLCSEQYSDPTLHSLFCPLLHDRWRVGRSTRAA